MGRESGSTTFRRLKGSLQTADSRDFERAVLPWIRLLWLDTIPAPALQSYDRIGVDLIALTNNGQADLVVQCKGFKAVEQELGPDQVRQCLESITSFAASEYKAITYLLVYNRLGSRDSMRAPIEGALQRLVSSGQVRRAELWPCDKLLREASSCLKKRFLKAIGSQSEDLRRRMATNTGALHDVPLRRSQLIVDRYQLKEKAEHADSISDPARELLALGAGNDARLILLGEAGFGKTTAAMRAAAMSHRRVFLVRAATFIEGPVNKSALLSHFSFIKEFLEDLPSEDYAVVLPLAKSVMDGLLSTRDTPAALVIDGLDESIALSRRGGLQWLFNSLLRYHIPVILTARTEFWRARSTDFATSFGIVAEQKGTMQRDVCVQLLELLPWDDERILALSKLYYSRLKDVTEKQNILAFADLVRHGTYVEYYGDIPRRPLFLRFILETVALSGIHRVGRAQLVEEWSRAKIVRDYIEPLKNAGLGRISIMKSGEPIESTIEIAFNAMKMASHLMSRVVEGRLEMLPACKVQDLLKQDCNLSNIVDPLGLFLNSLLVPIDSLGLAGSIRFGHKLYQEYYLARYIKDNESKFSGVDIPPSIMNWLAALGEI